MTTEEAIKQLEWYFEEDNGISADSVTKQAFNTIKKALSQKPKIIQEKQAESEKYQKAFDDGYDNGYAQARFDYEQNPCDKCAMKNSNSDYCENCTVAEYHGEKVGVPTKFVEQEPCNDAVSRAEAMTEIMMSKDAYLYIGHPTIRISDAVQAIRELPSVRPQEKTGKWIEDSDIDITGEKAY